MAEPKLTLDGVEWAVKRGEPYEGFLTDSHMTLDEAERISERMGARYGGTWPVVWRARYVSPWAEGPAPERADEIEGR